MGLLSFLPIIFIVVIFSIFFVLSDHSLHDFHTSFKRSRVSSTFVRSFYFLLLPILFIISVLFFELFDVRVPNLPLSDFSSQIIGDGRASSCSSLSYGSVDGLNFSIFVVEFVLHCLLDSFCIFAWTWFLLLSLPFYLFELALSIVLDFFLNFILIGSCMNVVSFKTEVHDELIDCIIDFVFPFQIIIIDSVGFSMRVGNN